MLQITSGHVLYIQVHVGELLYIIACVVLNSQYVVMRALGILEWKRIHTVERVHTCSVIT